jgi:hypothetical protein
MFFGFGVYQTMPEALTARHQKYADDAEFYKRAYYASRVLAGLGACLLPFIVPYSQIGATILAGIVAVVTVLDTIYVPRDQWKRCSMASNRLWVEEIRERGEYEKYKARIEEILRAESEELQLLIGLQQMLDQIKGQKNAPPEPSAEPAPSLP